MQVQTLIACGVKVASNAEDKQNIQTISKTMRGKAPNSTLHPQKMRDKYVTKKHAWDVG